MTHIEINGVAATVATLTVPAFEVYAHFTAMQVREGRVRGLALHLRRLDASTRELYGRGLDEERVRAEVRHALAASGVADASVRVYVCWPDGDEQPTVTVTVAEPHVMPRTPKQLLSVPFVRDHPHIKHLGSFAQRHARTLAGRAGYDEALLTTADGRVSEGAVTNIAFWDGERVVWPDAPCLMGVTRSLLEPRLPSARRRVTLADLPSYRAAFVTNARGFAPVERIDRAGRWPGLDGEAATLETPEAPEAPETGAGTGAGAGPGLDITPLVSYAVDGPLMERIAGVYDSLAQDRV